MFKKAKIFCQFLLFIFYAAAISVCVSGCKSRPVVITTDESIIASQISVARIEAVNAGLRDILSIYDIILGTEIDRAISGIDRALLALDRYDEFVLECIRRIRELEYQTRTGTGKNEDREGESEGQEQNFIMGRNPFLD